MVKIVTKITLLLFTLSLLILPAAAQDSAYSAVKSVALVIGDKLAVVNNAAVAMDQPAYVKNGRTLVPFRFLAESLGATVSWDGKTKTALLTLRNTEVKVVIGSKSAYVNKKSTSLDVPAEINGGRTFIPLRFVSEAFGAKVHYDSDSKTVSVTLVDTTGWKQYKDSNAGAIYYPADWTISGDTRTALVVYAPNSTSYNIKLITDKPLKAVENKKSEYAAQNYEYLGESTQAGVTILSFGKQDNENSGNSNLVVVIIGAGKSGSYVTDISTTYNTLFYDFAIGEKLSPV